MGKYTDNKIIKILVERFFLTFEQAENLYFAYPLTGSCEEGVQTVAKMYELSPETVREVFYSLDDLYQIVKEDEEKLRKWWETGKM